MNTQTPRSRKQQAASSPPGGRLDPDGVTADDLTDLRAIAEAAEQVRRDEAWSPSASPRPGRGRSWNQIAVALGISRQAARHRFASKLS